MHLKKGYCYEEVSFTLRRNDEGKQAQYNSKQPQRDGKQPQHDGKQPQHNGKQPPKGSEHSGKPLPPKA
ncbi:hypothetical protein BA904_25230 [Klebsiella pneumoniae]|nr:hypothetical protein BA904_25230 [Klebsiella pneumoniae]